MKHHLRPPWIPLAFMLLTSACSSRLETEWLPGGQLTSDAAPRQLTGVPFNLTRPEFILTETPTDGATSTYRMEVAWVADPRQSFTLDIDPALFSEADFRAFTGPHGEVSESRATVRDQVVATFQGVAGLVKGVISAGASLAALDASRGGIVASAASSECIVKALDLLSERAVLLEQRRTPLLRPEKPPVEAMKLGNLSNEQWRMANPSEIDRLRVIKDLLTSPQPGDLDSVLPLSAVDRAWMLSLSVVLSTWVYPSYAIENLKRTLEERQYSGLALEWVLDCKALLSQPQLDLKSLRSKIDSAPSDVAAAKKILGLVIDALKAGGSDCALALSTIRFILDQDDQFRYRRMLSLEAEMGDRRREIADNPSGSSLAPDPSLQSIYRKWLATIDAVDEGMRQEQLLDILRQAPGFGRITDHAIAEGMRDYTRAREELLVAQKAIEEKRARLVPKDPPAAARKESTLPMASVQAPGGLGQDPKGWSGKIKQLLGESLPSVVVVIEGGYVQ